MRKIINYLCLCLCVPAIAIGAPINPFMTDGCSSFPDGTIRQQSLWLNCCIRHDIEYWKGGTYEQRLAADHALEQCVVNVGEAKIARLMLAGVRVGGSPYFPTAYRWGYGWPYMRGYKALNEEETADVERKLEMLRLKDKSVIAPLNAE